MLLRIIDEKKGILFGPNIPPGLFTTYRLLEGRKRWKDSNLEFLPTNYNLDLLDPYITDRQEPTKNSPKSTKKGTYSPRTKCMPHQISALNAARGKENFAFFMEQGTGKTKVILDLCGELFADGEITGLLAVSKKGPHRQWAEEEAPKHLGCSFKAHFWDGKKMRFSSSSGKGDAIEIISVNWEALSRSKACAEIVSDFCKRHAGKLAIAADESQKIKSASTDVHKSITALKPLSSHRYLATGTPLAKDLTDEWSQLLWLDEKIIGIRYKTTFQREYCIMGGFENRSVIGHRNVEKFKQITAPHIFRATKEEIGLLPKQRSLWRFDLTANQKKKIQQLKNQLKSSVEDPENSRQQASVIFNKIRQVSCGFIIDDEGETTLIDPPDKNTRLEAAFSWLDGLDGRKAIIWAAFRRDILMLTQMANQKGIQCVTFDGSTSDKDRANAKQRFNYEESCQLFIGNPAAAGTGLNLQISGCQEALYYSNSFNAIDRWQSEDRIDRIGSAGACHYTDLIGIGSLDSYTLTNLQRKKSLSTFVLDDREIRKVISELEGKSEINGNELLDHEW